MRIPAPSVEDRLKSAPLERRRRHHMIHLSGMHYGAGQSLDCLVVLILLQKKNRIREGDKLRLSKTL